MGSDEDPFAGMIVSVGSEAKTAVHRVPAFYRVTMWLVALIAAAACIFCLAVPFLFLVNFDALYAAFAGSVLAGWALLSALSAALRSGDRFAAHHDGLIWRDRSGRTTMLPWSEIRHLRARPYLRRLDVRGARRSATIRLPFVLTDYDQLAARIAVEARHQPHRSGMDGSRREFRPVVSDALIPAVAPVVVGLSIHLYGTVLIMAWLIAAGALAYWMVGWRRLQLGADALVVVRRFGSAVISLADVTALSMTVEDTRSRVRPTVVLDLRNGRRARFTGVREGERALYEALLDAVQKHGSTLEHVPRMVTQHLEQEAVL